MVGAWERARVTAPRKAQPLGAAMRTARVASIEGRKASIRVRGAEAPVDAQIAPSPVTPPPVVRALAALGTPDSTGAVRIAWRGSV